jgi:hypothetical protein
MEPKPRFLLLDFAGLVHGNPPPEFFQVFGAGRNTRHLARVEGPFPDAPFVPESLRGLYRSVEYPNVYIGTDASHFGVHEKKLLNRRYSGHEDLFTILTVNPVCLDEITFEQAVAHELGADIDTSAQVLEFFGGAPPVAAIRETYGSIQMLNSSRRLEIRSDYHFIKTNLVCEKYQNRCSGDDFSEFCIGAIDYFEQEFPDSSITQPYKIQMWSLCLDRNLNLPFPDAH